MTARRDEEQLPPVDAKQLSTLGHDIRQCFFVMRTGYDLLRRVRDEPDQFEEVCGLMETEERKACELLEEIIALARRGLPQ
jgi:hypothetical protein